jgi:hypothetical protein
VDEHLRRPVRAERREAGGGQPPQHPQAVRGQAHADDLGRGHHHLPRVRPRAARLLLRRALPVLHDERAARFRRIPVAGQRDVGRLAGGAGQLRQALPDRRGDAEGVAGQGWPPPTSTRVSPPPNTSVRRCWTSAGTSCRPTSCRTRRG